jgi:hypothetical protein
MSEDLLYERDPSLFRNSNGRVHGQRTKVCIEFYDAQNRAALQFGTVRSFVSSKARKVAPLAPADAAGKVVAVSVGSKRYGTALGGLGLANPISSKSKTTAGIAMQEQISAKKFLIISCIGCDFRTSW